jgi:hypothetical protein
MCKIENKKIVLVDYKLMFKKNWIGNAFCSYEYDTEREGFKNLLRIDLDILYPISKASTPIQESFEAEIKYSEDISQSFDLINAYLKKKYIGTEIITVKTIFEFNYVGKIDYKIRLTSIGPKMTPYEIASLKNGKHFALSDMNEKQAISCLYENLIW